MTECWDPIASVVVPLVILNFVGSTLAFALICLGEKVFSSKPISYPVETSDDDEASDDDEENTGRSTDETLIETISDLDLINHVRESSILSVVSADTTPETRKPLLTQVQTDVPASPESMAGALISITRKIASTIDSATDIPTDKKQELATLLKGIPGFITKVVDMDDNELSSILKRTNTSTTSTITTTDKSDQVRKESEYLMQTLESLRK